MFESAPDTPPKSPSSRSLHADSQGTGPWQVLFLTVLAFTAIACITINVYFPEAAVKDLSEKIEEAVARTAAEAESGDPDGTDDGAGEGSEGQEGGEMRASFLVRAAHAALGLLLDVSAPEAAAQQVVAPEITNPAIRSIIASRSTRVRQLEDYKNQGVLGENNQALVAVRDLGSLPLQERARVQKLVRDENADRERMFKEIAAATNVDLSQLPKIRETYAQTLRQNAAKGQWIQQPGGQWVRKQ